MWSSAKSRRYTSLPPKTRVSESSEATASTSLASARKAHWASASAGACTKGMPKHSSRASMSDCISGVTVSVFRFARCISPKSSWRSSWSSASMRWNSRSSISSSAKSPLSPFAWLLLAAPRPPLPPALPPGGRLELLAPPEAPLPRAAHSPSTPSCRQRQRYWKCVVHHTLSSGPMASEALDGPLREGGGAGAAAAAATAAAAASAGAAPVSTEPRSTGCASA
mmetsp:Transcript_170749/g.414891  ORF Transcript_170749/g.414891 Transcript_170749/m.414891 type:complete len:224 (-) Transcript_170749:586-1257(-)